MVLQELIESTEFVLKKSKVRDLRSLFENRVRHLFGVELEVLPCEHDVINDENVENPPHQWIRVVCTEHPEQLERAKEYIISVCNPEVRSRVDFQICDLLDERTSFNIVDEVEEKTCAYLAVDSEGFLEICGSKMAVALASSSLQQMKFLSSPSEGKDSVEPQEEREEYKQLEKETTENFEAEVVWYKRSDTPKVVKPSKPANASSAKECSSENLPVEENDSESTTNSTGVSEKPGIESKSNQELNGNDIPLNTSADSITESEAAESLRDFAIKLRYSEAEVSAALFKLGPEADKNKLLMELVKAQASAKQIEEGSSMERPTYVQSTPVGDPGTFRSIVIDGSNVAMSHGNQKVFSCRGIGIAVDWFINKGHRDIKVFVPSWRKESTKLESPIIDQEVMTRLDEDNILIWTPSRRINGRRVVCYDDRFIIKLAHQTDGVIVSNDNFRDLQNESLEWKKVIEQRLLMYSFADDRFMPPDDPAGRHGPTLDEFLHKGCGKACPYGRRCTYGNRCKYLHPERNSKTESEMGELARQLSEKKLFLTPPEIPYSEVIKDNTGSFRESSRQGRPLPPLPDMPAYLLTKPLPPTPKELPQRQAKPLPIPQAEMHHNMTRKFPPTLRMNHSSQGQRPASDPLPQRPLYYEGNGMQEQYTRSLTRRGSVPHVMPGGPPYIEGYPSLPGGHYSHPMYPTHHNMTHPPDIQRGMVPSVDSRPVMHDDGYGACGYQQSYQQVQPGYLPQHWGAATPFQQPQYQLGPPYHISLSGHPHFQHQYVNNYGGQGNSYFRTRAPPTDTDVTDGVSEGTNVSGRTGECAEEGRIKAYETLLEVFPEDAAKILKLIDENPEISDVEKLTQLLLDEE